MVTVSSLWPSTKMKQHERFYAKVFFADRSEVNLNLIHGAMIFDDNYCYACGKTVNDLYIHSASHEHLCHFPNHPFHRYKARIFARAGLMYAPGTQLTPFVTSAPITVPLLSLPDVSNDEFGNYTYCDLCRTHVMNVPEHHCASYLHCRQEVSWELYEYVINWVFHEHHRIAKFHACTLCRMTFMTQSDATLHFTSHVHLNELMCAQETRFRAMVLADCIKMNCCMIVERKTTVDEVVEFFATNPNIGIARKNMMLFKLAMEYTPKSLEPAGFMDLIVIEKYWPGTRFFATCMAMWLYSHNLITGASTHDMVKPFVERMAYLFQVKVNDGVIGTIAGANRLTIGGIFITHMPTTNIIPIQKAIGRTPLSVTA